MIGAGIFKQIKINKKTKLAIALVFFLIFYTVSIHPFIISSLSGVYAFDGTVYVMLGESIATSQGYVDLANPEKLEYTNFPFIFPLLLSFIITLFGMDFFAMKMVVAIIGVVSLYFIYGLMKKHTTENKALIITILTGFTTLFYLHAIGLKSEMPYMLFSVLALIFLEKYSEDEKHFTRNLVVASVFILLGFFTRYIGLVLVVAALIFIYLEKNDFKLKAKKAFSILLITITPILLWFWRNTSFPNSEIGYTPMFFFPKEDLIGTIILRITNSILINIYIILEIILPGNFFAAIDYWFLLGNEAFLIRFILSILVSIIFLYSLLKKSLQKISIIEIYVLLYLGLILVYPFSFPRLLVPLVPFIFYYLISGLEDISKTLKIIPANAILGVVVFSVLLFSFNENMDFLDNGSCFDCKTEELLALQDEFGNNPDLWKNEACLYCRNNLSLVIKDYREMAYFIKNNTPQDALIISGNPHLIYLLTERESISYPLKIEIDYPIEFDEKWFYLEESNVKYLLDEKRYPELAEHCGEECYFLYEGFPDRDMKKILNENNLIEEFSHRQGRLIIVKFRKTDPG